MSATDGVHERLAELPLGSETVYRGSFLEVRRDQVRLPDGSQSSREYIVHPGAAVMVPLLDDGRVLIERQYRYPVRQVFLARIFFRPQSGSCSRKPATLQPSGRF
jgi:ADP-ribose pyrophosphatase